MQSGNGSDRVEEKLDGVFSVESVPRMGRLQSDLERLFAQLSGGLKTVEFVRSNEKLRQPKLLECEGNLRPPRKDLGK